MCDETEPKSPKGVPLANVGDGAEMPSTYVDLTEQEALASAAEMLVEGASELAKGASDTVLGKILNYAKNSPGDRQR